jgi:hypothetical protein
VSTQRSNLRHKLLVVSSALALALGAAQASRAQAQGDQPQNDQKNSPSQSSNDNFSAGINLGKDASAKDVGLPLYPGSRRRKDTSDDSSALNMGLWGGSTGFKMALLKMETNDSPDKVAAYYRKALAKYGKVLTCPAPDGSAATSGNASQDKSSNALDCGTDKPDKGGIELKSGTKEKQHIVGITPEGSVTTFQLIYVETHGLDNNK